MYTEDSPLTARPFASPEQVVAYILSHPHDNYSDDAIRTAIVPALVGRSTPNVRCGRWGLALRRGRTMQSRLMSGDCSPMPYRRELKMQLSET